MRQSGCTPWSSGGLWKLGSGSFDGVLTRDAGYHGDHAGDISASGSLVQGQQAGEISLGRDGGRDMRLSLRKEPSLRSWPREWEWRQSFKCYYPGRIDAAQHHRGTKAG